MGEGIASIERRAALTAAAKRSGPLRDKFQRTVVEGDGVLLAQTQPTEVVWRVQRVTPATEREYAGAVWVDVVATTRVLCPERLPSDNMILVIPVEPPTEERAAGGERETHAPPAPGRTASGLYVPPEDK